MFSLGTEKYHPAFIEDINKNKNKFDRNDTDASFKRLISIVILRNSAYKQIRKEKYGYSYPGNVTDYSVALISYLSEMRVNLDEIWRTQKAPDAFTKNVDYIAPIVGNTIKKLCDTHGVIARELAKGRKVGGKTLWKTLIDQSLKLPSGFTYEGPTPNPNDPDGELDANKKKIIRTGSAKLWALASWAKETNNLTPTQRGIAGTVAGYLPRGRVPSEKQTKQLIKALNEAELLGFDFIG